MLRVSGQESRRKHSPSARRDKSIGKGSSRTVGKELTEYAAQPAKRALMGQCGDNCSSRWHILRLDKMEAKLLQAEANL